LEDGKKTLEMEEQIKSLNVALRITGLVFAPEHLEITWRLMLLIQEKGELVTLKDIVNLQCEVEERHSKK
jgi:hypothetical protein